MINKDIFLGLIAFSFFMSASFSVNAKPTRPEVYIPLGVSGSKHYVASWFINYKEDKVVVCSQSNSTGIPKCLQSKLTIGSLVGVLEKDRSLLATDYVPLGAKYANYYMSAWFLDKKTAKAIVCTQGNIRGEPRCKATDKRFDAP